jgi:hypothetical protein
MNEREEKLMAKREESGVRRRVALTEACRERPRKLKYSSSQKSNPNPIQRTKARQEMKNCPPTDLNI